MATRRPKRVWARVILALVVMAVAGALGGFFAAQFGNGAGIAFTAGLPVGVLALVAGAWADDANQP